MTTPKMPEIRQTLDRARAMAGREDTQDFAVEAPKLLARLVQILDLYVGHEPTLAEEAEYERATHRAGVLREAGALANELIAAVNRTDPDASAKADAYRAYSDRLHEIADGEETDTREGKPTTETGPTCGRCRRPFDPADTSWNGGARHGDTPFCRSCDAWLCTTHVAGGDR